MYGVAQKDVEQVKWLQIKAVLQRQIHTRIQSWHITLLPLIIRLNSIKMVIMINSQVNSSKTKQNFIARFDPHLAIITLEMVILISQINS